MNRLKSYISATLAIILNAAISMAGNVVTYNDTTLKTGQTILFDVATPFTLSAKIKFAPNESSFGRPEQLFDIIAGDDTFSICQGIQSIGSFEPSPFLKISHNQTSVQISQAERLIKSDKTITVRLTGNSTSGLRLFINGNAVDLGSITGNQQLSDIHIKACRTITFLSINFESNGAADNQPILTLDEIITRLQSSPSAPAGLYVWLDRENDPHRAIPGGFYKLAVLPDSVTKGYDIIYLEGASVNKDSWKTGMIKGKLIPTIFYNHYDLIWYDSNHEVIDREIFCNFIDDAIMQLNFPLYSTKMRFSRLNGSASSLIQTR
ncbi:MAG: hypothetical protein K2H44_01335 [Muribaculaceae bacterium]|nr:hypothetical protein [Muribaculaceae bacterium]